VQEQNQNGDVPVVQTQDRDAPPMQKQTQGRDVPPQESEPRKVPPQPHSLSAPPAPHKPHQRPPPLPPTPAFPRRDFSPCALARFPSARPLWKAYKGAQPAAEPETPAQRRAGTSRAQTGGGCPENAPWRGKTLAGYANLQTPPFPPNALTNPAPSLPPASRFPFDQQIKYN